MLHPWLLVLMSSMILTSLSLSFLSTEASIMRPLIHPIVVFYEGVAALGLTQVTEMSMLDLQVAFKEACGFNPEFVANLWAELKVDWRGADIEHLFWTLHIDKNPISIRSLKVVFDANLSESMVCSVIALFNQAVREARATSPHARHDFH